MLIETYNCTSDSGGRQIDSRLNAFIIYEDVAAGKKAKETCDALAASLGSSWALDLEMFSFDSLRILRTREVAGAAISTADIIIFSGNRAELPMEVLKWIESFLGTPDRPIALVALFAHGSGHGEEPSKSEEYLAGLAQKRGIQYFSQVDKRAAEHKKEANEFDSAIEISE
jgi:hypothetical protein